MSKSARNKALECLSTALLDGTERRFLANAPLMAIVEAVLVLDDAGLLIDPEVADLDPDVPIPYTVVEQPAAAQGTAPSARTIAIHAAIYLHDCAEAHDDGMLGQSSHALRFGYLAQECFESLGLAGIDAARAEVRAAVPLPEPELHILAGSKCFECGQTLNDSGVCTNRSCQMMPF